MPDTKDIHGGDPAAVARSLGLKGVPEIQYDFSVNINPLGMPPAVERALLSADEAIYSNYPETYAESAVSALAKAHGVKPESLLAGNGSTEIFFWIIQTLRPEKAGCIAPSYSGYADICSAAGIDFEYTGKALPENNFRINPDMISVSDAEFMFIGTPNNPTGLTVRRDDILRIAASMPQKYFVVDESFIDFLPNAKSCSLITDKLPDNVIVVKSLTKFFAIAGLRLGMVCGSLKTIGKIAKIRLPWSVNALSQMIAPLLYSDEKYILQSRKLIGELRREFSSKLAKLTQIKIFPSEANFLLCRLENSEFTLGFLQGKLLKRGILIRSCRDIEGLGDKYFRLAVRSREENEFLICNLHKVFNQSVSKSALSTQHSKIPKTSRGTSLQSEIFNLKSKIFSPLMIVGTASGSGKSLIVSALCRYFARRGIRVAPFKAQNMSLNSFVTKEGGEMGRAQVVQAKAAKLEPHTDMNPVLLKPTGDAGSQLIVNGRPVCNVNSREYYDEKCDVRRKALDAYDRLAAKYNLIIIEGAGSPAEINLQDKDFVNMAMAEYAGAKTILVADIDPGGVFASIYGTVKLIPSRYRKLICGVIINKFRGDASLLDDGIREIEKLTGVPVLGVIPYLKDLRIEEEDSLGLGIGNSKFEIGDFNCQLPTVNSQVSTVNCQLLDIAVIRLPRISNYTDFLPFETVPGVNLRYVFDPQRLGRPDLIILPGTKNTRADMEFLRETGFDQKLRDAVKNGIPLFGICGGYQMLGESISDFDGVEGRAGEEAGLSLLPLKTVLEMEKKLSLVSGISNKILSFAKHGTPFHGYEIHVGRTVSTVGMQSAPLTITKRQEETCEEPAGAISEDGLVFGCYVHGIFDEKKMRDQLLKWLCGRKGIDSEALTEVEMYNSETVFEKLADILEEYIDMKTVERWLGV